jgi:hypothetical protein
MVPAGFFICCATYVLCAFALRYDAFRWGNQLEAPGLSTLGLTGILYAPALVISAFLAIGLFIGTIRKKHARIHFLSIFLLPVSFSFLQFVPVPKFTDGAARRLKSLGLSEELIAFAAEEIKGPRSGWMEYDRTKQIIESPPFNKLELEHPPHMYVEGSSLICLLGGPFSMRWGISISGLRGKKPVMPSNSYDQRPVSTEIVVFGIPQDGPLPPHN